MGRRGKRPAPSSGPASSKTSVTDPVLAEALAAGGLFRPLPPNKRHELNKMVETLLHLSSNFGQDPPSTPQGLYEEHLQLSALLKNIVELEKCNLNRKLLGSRVGHAGAMIKWVEEHGGSVQGVKPHNFGERGLGLKVREDCASGSVVLKIPRKCMMSTDTARDSEIGRLIETDPMLKTMSNVSLAIHVLLEKTSPASFWEPYINSLPHTYNTVLYFTPEEFQELKGSPAYEDALKQFKYVARQYAYFYRKFQETILKDYFTFEEYRWAVSTVMTRQNQVPSLHEEDKFVNSLIPFWDLANHDNGQLSTDYDDEEKVIKCMAHRDFKKDEEFTIFYGARGNHDLLVHNGFVFENNDHDCLQIKLGISKNDPLAKTKFELLARLTVSPQGHFALKKSEKPVDQMLLAFLRVMCLNTKEQLDSWAEEEKIRDLLNEKTDEDLDKKAFQYLLTRCTLLLRSYPTTLEDDVEKMEKSDNLSQSVRFCLALRMAEKKILNATIKYCQEKVN